MMKKTSNVEPNPDRRQWTKPELTAVGTVGQVLKQGGGKPSVLNADPGEPRKTGPTQG